MLTAHVTGRSRVEGTHVFLDEPRCEAEWQSRFDELTRAALRESDGRPWLPEWCSEAANGRLPLPNYFASSLSSNLAVF